MKNPMATRPKNPLTDKPLTDRQIERVELLRTIRRRAKVAARSGDPAKRGPARRVLAQVPAEIVRVYRDGA